MDNKAKGNKIASNVFQEQTENNYQVSCQNIFISKLHWWLNDQPILLQK